MSTLSFVQSGSAALSAGIKSSTREALGLHLEPGIASANRLWLRGQIRGVESLGEAAGRSRSWLPRKTNSVPKLKATLETTVAGQTIHTEVDLDSSGYFEATLDATLPPTNRSWRTARVQVAFAGKGTSETGLIWTLPPEPGEMILVTLPTGHEANSPQWHLPSRPAALNAHMEAKNKVPPIYYLASAEAEGAQATLARALHQQGWPSGRCLLFPQQSGSNNISRAIERFRWLFPTSQVTHLVDLNRGHDENPACFNRSEPDSSVPLEVLRPALKSSSSLRPLRAGLTPRQPLVFCHGMLACGMLKMQVPSQENYFSVLRDHLNELGIPALFPVVEPVGGAAARAEQLRDQIRRWTEEPVNLVAHSMGGLDSRFMISQLGMGKQVQSLTTLSTPHRGSFLADWCTKNYRHRLPLLFAMEAAGINVDGLRDCSPAKSHEFNARNPDVPGVGYFSFGGDVSTARLTPMLRRAWGLLHAVEGPNDGLVSVASARWGEYLGSLAADHFAQTPDGMWVHPDETFDGRAFMVRLLQDLARRGF